MPDVNADDLPVVTVPTVDARALIVDDPAGTPVLALGPPPGHVPQVVIPAAAMGYNTGTPTLDRDAGSGSLLPVWLLGDGATEGIGSVFVVPPGWTTGRIKVMFANQGGLAGNVVLRADVDLTVEHGNTIVSSAGVKTTVAALTGTGIARRATLRDINTAPGTVIVVKVARFGGDAADNLTSDIGVFGVIIEQLT